MKYVNCDIFLIIKNLLKYNFRWNLKILRSVRFELTTLRL